MMIMTRMLVLFFWLAVLAADAAQPPTVTVRRTTATQALIEVQGYQPGQTCTLVVSPAVPALDASQGGSPDCTRQAVVSGHTLTYVLGQTSAATGTNGQWYSQALAANTTYTYTLTLGGIATPLTGSFQTATIPLGRSAPPAIPTDGSGACAWPTVDFGARGNKVIDPLTGAPLLTLYRPQDVTNSFGSLLPVSGGMPVCAPGLVTTFDGKQGYHCSFGQYSNWNNNRGGGYAGLYFIEHTSDPDAIPDMRFYGLLTWNGGAYWNQGGCNDNFTSPFMTTDPNVLYCLGQTNTDQAPILFKGQFTGHQTGQDADTHSAASYLLTGTTWTPVTDQTRTLTTLLTEFDPTAQAWTGFSYWSEFGIQNDRLVLSFANGIQGSMGWVVVFDPALVGTDPGCMAHAGGAYANTPGCIVAARPPHTLTPFSAGRWGGDLHIVFDFGDGWLSISSNIPPGTRDGWGRYQVTFPAGLPAAPDTCPASASNWPATVPAWPKGQQCALAQIAGDPVSTVQPHSIGGLQPGDQACTGAGPLGECVRFLASVDATHWWVQRQWGYPGQGAAATTAAPNAQFVMVFNGYNLSSGLSGGAMWWNWAADPHATGVATVAPDPDIELAHYFYAETPLGGVSLTTSDGQYTMRPGRLPAAFHQPLTAITASPTFHGITGPFGGNFLQQHPAPPPLHATADEAAYFFDARPLSGGQASCVAQPGVTISPIAGDLYRVRWPDLSSNCVYQTYKLLPILANSGLHTLTDVSPHILTGTNADQYRFCVTLRAGDCQANSQPGDVYANVPNLTTLTCADAYNSVTADLCLTPQHGYMQGVTQINQTRPDPSGRNGRVLTYGLAPPRAATIYWNARALPDARWALVEAGPINGSTAVMLARIPSLPPLESTNRQDFLPFTVQTSGATPPIGTADLIVRFGYDPQFRCTARDEACVVAANSAPFSFAGDALAGLPANTRTITLPAQPDRFLYWQLVYRDAGGNVLRTSATHVN